MWLLQFTLSVNNPALFELGDGAVTGFFKFLFVSLAFLYLLFAFVVTRQIKVMRMTLITPVSPIIRTIGYVHFLIVFLVFLGMLLFL